MYSNNEIYVILQENKFRIRKKQHGHVAYVRLITSRSRKAYGRYRYLVMAFAIAMANCYVDHDD